MSYWGHHERRYDDARLAKVSGKRRSFAKERVAIRITASRDIERITGVGNHKRVQVDATGRRITAAAIHKTQTVEWTTRKLVTEIISIERGTALSAISAPALIQIVTTPKLYLLHSAVEVYAERVRDIASV